MTIKLQLAKAVLEVIGRHPATTGWISFCSTVILILEIIEHIQ